MYYKQSNEKEGFLRTKAPAFPLPLPSPARPFSLPFVDGFMAFPGEARLLPFSKAQKWPQGGLISKAPHGPGASFDEVKGLLLMKSRSAAETAGNRKKDKNRWKGKGLS